MYFAVSALCCDLFFILLLVFIPCLHTSHIPQFREFTLTPSISSQGESLVLAEAGSAEERRLKKARKRTATVEQGEHTHTHTHTHTLEHTHTHTHTSNTTIQVYKTLANHIGQPECATAHCSDEGAYRTVVRTFSVMPAVDGVHRVQTMTVDQTVHA